LLLLFYNFVIIVHLL